MSGTALHALFHLILGYAVHSGHNSPAGHGPALHLDARHRRTLRRARDYGSRTCPSRKKQGCQATPLVPEELLSAVTGLSHLPVLLAARDSHGLLCAFAAPVVVPLGILLHLYVFYQNLPCVCYMAVSPSCHLQGFF